MGLNPKETLIISVSGKKIPMKGFSKHYTPLDATPGPNAGKTGNFFKTSKSAEIIQILNLVNTVRLDIKNVVMEDFQFVGAFEYFDRASESGFGKFAEIGQNIARPLIAASALRDDLNVIVTNHEETISEDFKPLRKMKTIGKLVDNSLTMEGLFTVVLFTDIREAADGTLEYGFITNNNGTNTAKSPEGMFEKYIPNDMGVVVDAIAKYYDE